MDFVGSFWIQIFTNYAIDIFGENAMIIQANMKTYFVGPFLKQTTKDLTKYKQNDNQQCICLKKQNRQDYYIKRIIKLKICLEDVFFFLMNFANIL